MSFSVVQVKNVSELHAYFFLFARTEHIHKKISTGGSALKVPRKCFKAIFLLRKVLVMKFPPVNQ